MANAQHSRSFSPQDERHAIDARSWVRKPRRRPAPAREPAAVELWAAARHFGRLIGKLAPELDEAAAAHGEVVARALAVQLVSGIGCDVYDHAIAAAELEPAPDEARN